MCRGVLCSLTGHTTVRPFLVNLKAKDLGEREREGEREGKGERERVHYRTHTILVPFNLTNSTGSTQKLCCC